MGSILIDQYTYLHFSVGVVAYFWNISLFHWFILHSIFEILENTSFGMYFINHYISFWPGGKPKSDTFINNIGDILSAILGWLSAFYIDEFANQYGLYR